MAVTDDFRRQWIEMQQELGTEIEECELAEQPGMISQTLSLPGVLYDKNPLDKTDPPAKAVKYIQIPYQYLADVLNNMNNAAVEVSSLNAVLEGTVLIVTDRTGTHQSCDTAEAAKAAKSEWDNTYKPQIQTATQDANTATQNANTATADAERVNAQLVGMTVTITNRQGVSNSVDIGFEIYRTYASVAAMNADAANVPQGKFVVIATSSATDPDNAKLYCKNSQGSFTFLSDLDQASSAAWADWLENMKPLIEADHQQADTDHQTAVSDHATASSDHSTASSDHTASVAATNAANTQANRAKGYNDHPWQIGNDGYIYVWDEETQSMVRTNKMIISFDDLTDEQKEAMMEAFMDSLVFASDQTCEDIIDEL